MQPRYSPDGRHIVFVSDRDGSENIWIADSNGANPRALTTGERENYVSPVWTPRRQLCRRDEGHPALALPQGRRVRAPDERDSESRLPRGCGRARASRCSIQGRSPISLGQSARESRWRIPHQARAGRRRAGVGTAHASQLGDGSWAPTRSASSIARPGGSWSTPTARRRLPAGAESDGRWLVYAARCARGAQAPGPCDGRNAGWSWMCSETITRAAVRAIATSTRVRHSRRIRRH